MPSTKLLSGREVSFVEPTMADFKEARKFAEAHKYEVDEALALRCLTGVEGKDGEMQALDPAKVQDYVAAAEPLLTIKENQNYRTLFFAAYMLTEEEIEQIKEQLKADSGGVQRLLSGRSVVFREPTMADYKEAKKFAEKKKYDVDETLAMLCLEAVEGKDGQMVGVTEMGDPDYVRVGNKIFSIKEHQNYRTLFFALHMLTDEEVEQIKEQAKNL